MPASLKRQEQRVCDAERVVEHRLHHEHVGGSLLERQDLSAAGLLGALEVLARTAEQLVS
ncbi:hypothetical protein [Myxococcus sp. AM010]|uniref:hypothetical protein n=1 Tax=Myxococcus sp. AM010 TaxID=2745138 RepID=UPI001595AEC8|nr:hypothetical protein [Myxococcus sp. AM010]NVJ14319.1 hypothetical protein [Myxococcus sp. AM010]